MARKARQTTGTGIYHVMLRGINRQVIFESNADYSYFIRILYRMVYPMDESRHPCTKFLSPCVSKETLYFLKNKKLPGFSWKSLWIRIFCLSLQISYEKMGKLGDKYKTKSTRPIQDVLIWFTVAEVLDV